MPVDGPEKYGVWGDQPAPGVERLASSLPLDAERPPLRVGSAGVVRVGSTRVSLDLIVEEYEGGMTPDDMVRAYDTLQLTDVYAVIGWYLRHKEQASAYLKERAQQADVLRSRIESERPRVSREELLARRAAREKDIAPAGR